MGQRGFQKASNMKSIGGRGRGLAWQEISQKRTHLKARDPFSYGRVLASQKKKKSPDDHSKAEAATKASPQAWRQRVCRSRETRLREHQAVAPTFTHF